MWVWSPVGKLRSHMTLGQKKKKKQCWNEFNKGFTNYLTFFWGIMHRKVSIMTQSTTYGFHKLNAGCQNWARKRGGEPELFQAPRSPPYLLLVTPWPSSNIDYCCRFILYTNGIVQYALFCLAPFNNRSIPFFFLTAYYASVLCCWGWRVGRRVRQA